MSANSDVANSLTSRALLIERAKAGLVEDVLEILFKLELSLFAEINRLDPTDVARTSAKRARLEKLLASTRERIAEFYRESRDDPRQLELPKCDN